MAYKTDSYKLEPTQWRDVNLGSAVLAAVPGQQPDRDEFKDSGGADTGVDTYAIAVGEGVDGSFELQHGYKNGTNLVFHVHWQGIAAPTGTDYVRWQLTYVVARDGEILESSTQIAVESGIDTQYIFTRSDFAEIDGSGFLVGDQFLFKLERVAATGDAYAGDALIATARIHLEVNSLGSRSITSK